MATKKNKIKIFVVISIIISILAFLVIIGWYILFPIYFVMNFVNTSGGYTEIHTKLNGNMIYEISDSLKNENWKYNLPTAWIDKLSKDVPDYDNNLWYYLKKTDTTNEIILQVNGSNIIYLYAVYKNTIRIHHRKMSDKEREEYEELLLQTVFKDIEKEAKKQNLPNSVIYLPKEQLEKYGYNEFAKKIYPEKKEKKVTLPPSTSCKIFDSAYFCTL